MNNIKRYGMAAAPIAIIIFVIAAVMISGTMFFLCKATDDCNPFGSSSLGKQIKTSSENAKATGAALQFFYGLEIPENLNMVQSSRKHAYCNIGPASGDQRYRCANAPEKGDITGAADSYNPYPQDITNLIPFFSSFGFSFTAEYQDEAILDISKGKSGETSSTFIFVIPVAGGENVEPTFKITTGQTAVGVMNQ